MSPAARGAWSTFSKASVCGEGAPCTVTSVKDAEEKYAAGPVYLAHVADWRLVADQWWRAMPRVHSQYPQLLAEMYAFTMAVANSSLPFSLVSSFMVSDPKTMSPTEAWAWVDDIAAAHGPAAVCAGADPVTLPAATRARPLPALPTTLHYCQKYEAAGHLFAKRKVPHDFFKCGGGPMPFNPKQLTGNLTAALAAAGKNKLRAKVVLRTAFMICHLVPIANAALASYQLSVCG